MARFPVTYPHRKFQETLSKKIGTHRVEDVQGIAVDLTSFQGGRMEIFTSFRLTCFVTDRESTLMMDQRHAREPSKLQGHVQPDQS